MKNENFDAPDKDLGLTFAPTTDGGVAVMKDANATQTFSTIRVGAKELRDAIDKHLRGVVEERLEMIRADAIIEKELGRRIEIAVKFHAARIDSDVKAEVVAAIRKRLLGLASGMKLEISLSQSNAADTPSGAD